MADIRAALCFYTVLFEESAMIDRRERRFARSTLGFYLALAAGVVLGVGSLLVVGAPPWARADETHQSKVYATGFELPTFEAGSALVGVDGWTTLFFMDPDAAKITDVHKKSGRQSVEVWGGDLESTADFTPPYDAVGSYRQPVNFQVSQDKPIVVVEADLLLETDRAATGDDFFSMTIAARSGDGETLGEAGISSDGSADVYGFDTASGDPPLLRTPTSLNRWHHLSMAMDFSGETTTVSYWLDGELLIVTPTTSTSNVLLRG